MEAIPFKCCTVYYLGWSELNRSAEESLKGDKMTVMDIFEFKDINRPDPYNQIWFKETGQC